MRRAAALLTACALAMFVVPGRATGQDGERPAGGEDVLAVVGGDVYTGTGVVHRRGTVVCRDGKIEALGVDIKVPEGARIIDATGRRVLPGFVAPHGNNFGIRAGRPRNGEKYADCIDADSIYAELALSAGITSYLARGRARGRTMYTDQSAVLKPAFRAPELMVVKEPAALTLAWSNRAASERVAFEQMLVKAKKWIDDGSKGRAPAPSGVLAAIKRDIPVVIGAGERSDIKRALALAKKHDLRLVLDGAYEAWTVPEDIGAAGATAIVRPRLRRWPTTGLEDSTGARIEAAGILERAGVPFCILPPGGFGGGGHGISLGGVTGRDMLTYSIEAAFAIRGGASEDACLRAITLTAAEAIGVDDRVGSLEVGKDADIVIHQGDPFDYRKLIEVTIVSGRVLYDRQKSTILGHLPDR